MAANDYHLTSAWRVLGGVDEVFDLVSRDDDLARWWPAAFLDVLTLERGEPETGIGAIVRMETRGWLPYRLHWHLKVDDVEPQKRLSFAVWGDFEGRGTWTFAQNGPWTDVGFDWQVTVRKPLIRWLSWLGRPLFVSNHRWAMARGEESLRLELTRRHADAELKKTLATPPLAPSYGPVAIVGAIGLGALALLSRRR